MARRTVIWHIGPADPGTDFLADALAARKDELAGRGVALPSGSWPEIEQQIWDHKGLSLLSTPGISRAGREKVALRLAGLRDVELHLVLLVRDLPTQVYSGWQAGIQNGSTTGLEKYAARVLDNGRSHWQAEEFWTGRDLEVVLPLWTRAIVPDRVHVVAATRETDLWDSFLDIAGIEHLPCPSDRISPQFAAALDTERMLDITTGWTKLIADQGHDLRGSLVEGAGGTGQVPSRSEQFEAIADLLAEATGEVARLRQQVAVLRLENERLDRKRRKHKRRVAELTEEMAGPGTANP